MIYLISDLHGEETRGLRAYLEAYNEGDLLIILGDVGLKFEENEKNLKFTENFLKIDKPVAIVEGNHENHAYLNSFPEEEWCGGRINRLTPCIIRLKRGHIFDIEGKSFFVMGGCKSSAKWKDMGLWFDGEMPSCEEIATARKNLSKVGSHVDYVLTHKYSPEMDGAPDTLEGLVKYIDENVSFNHWYAGHWHMKKCYDEKHTIVYDDPVVLN